jgi:5-methylcytosine-specific restriction endonuclease McrA
VDQGFHARVLADSVSPAGIRLTTLEVRFPRFILSEFNTHRVFCLDGETELYFDMPSYEKNGGTRRFTMTLREFHKKWHHGASPRKNRSRKIKVDKLCFSATYSARELAPLVGFSGYTGVDLLTRRANIPRVAIQGQPYRVRGLDVAHWLYDPKRSENRQPLRERLAAMNLRSCDESTGEIYHTHVRDICFSGTKDVFRVVLEDGREIVSTKDHQFLTRGGWQRLEDAVGLELSKGGIATWKKAAEFAMNGVDAYRDPEWLRAQRSEGYSARAIADLAGVTLDQVKYQFRKHQIPASNLELVWKRRTSTPWNKGRRYCNILTRGQHGTARVRRGEESHLWRGGVTPARKRIGQWTQGEAFRTHRRNSFHCVLCGSGRDLHAHHLDPVAHNPERACDPMNLTTLCHDCHGELHQRNIELVLLEFVEAGGEFGAFWGHVGGMRLRKPYAPKKKRARVRHFVGLERIEYVGERETYDIEVEGPYHNFVANGFIVHNSRNSASSRAVPTNKMVDRVLQSPAMPVEWGVNKPGMSASETLTSEQAEEAKAEWLRARDSAVERVRDLQKLNVHKQVINRIMEPFMWHTVIVTATEWENFFKLRLSENAQPEIRVAAQHMRAAIDASKPAPVVIGEWHLPLIQDDERSLPIEQLKKVSAARCARVSYLTHDGKRDLEKDIELCERLWTDRHLSPFEHVATPSGDGDFHANFRGWRQMRRELEEQTSV